MSSLIGVFINNLTEQEERLKELQAKAREEVIQEMKEDIDEYIPYKTGNLASSQEVKTTPNGISVRYDSCDYAKYAFNGVSASGKPKTYSTEVHSKATGNPIGTALAVHYDDWRETYIRVMRDGK